MANVGQHHQMKSRAMPELFSLRANIILLALVITAFSSTASASDEDTQPGKRYKIIKPIYLTATYESLNNRKISKETARAYLESKQYAKTSWVAFQCEVPAGTIMTIIGPAPKVWHLPFFAGRYFIRLEPDLSRGLDVILELNRGIEGDMDGLNSELFRPLE